jgi:hypothetical protein
MRAEKATIHITKIAAAKRQLEAAIRMFFAGEDELAIHTIAAAAFRVLRDLHNNRGKTFPAKMLEAGFFNIAKHYPEGNLPAGVLQVIQAAGLLPPFNELPPTFE